MTSVNQTLTTQTGTKPSGARPRSWIGVLILTVMSCGVALTATGNGHGRPCNCSPGSSDANIVEWDIPSPLDTSSGAITVDVHSSHSGRLWFLSRVGDVKLYRLEPGQPITTKNANWKSWELNPMSLTTGGLYRIKVHRNDREVFVRTHTSLQRIDTGDCTTSLMLVENCKRTVWLDQLTDEGSDATPHVSDLSSDDCNVYTTTAIFDGADALAPGLSYLQQLSKCRIDSQHSAGGTTTVKRWKVGGGAGFCAMAVDSAPCISGISVDPKREHLVYFAKPAANQIGELNVHTNYVRTWPMPSGVTEPRQVDVDDDGMVWTVTGSGHLVRLDPRKNRMSKHLMPAGSLADPFGVAADHGVIGYTNSAQDQNKVAMLFPKGYTFYVAPTTVCIQPKPVVLDFVVESAGTSKGTTPPIRKTVDAAISDKADGVFVEAPVGEVGSMIPLGITPDQSKKVGTYFYAIGLNLQSGFNRIGQIVLPTKHQKHGHARDDDDHDRDGKRDDSDDDDDNDGQKDWDDDDDDDDCVNDNDDNDDDNDGIDDRDDHKGRKETRHSRNDDVAGGQASEYPMDVDSSNFLLAATVTSLDPTSLLSVEIYGPAGQLLASALPTPGLSAVAVPTLGAGTYKIRVQNLGMSTTELATGILTQTAWPIELPLP